MPLYEFQCRQCRAKFTLYRKPEDYRKKAKCPDCGAMAGRIISMPNLITDTNFPGTGIVDKRLGERPIAGRRDYSQRLKKKGLVEISNREAINDIGD